MDPKLKPAGMITLVSKESTTIYSGMFPGLIAGKYKIDEILIDLRRLASKAGVSFLMAEIEGINTKKKKLLLAGRPEISYSSLSLNIGTETNINPKTVNAKEENLACPIKPFSKSLKWISDQDIYKDDYSAIPFVIVGAGFAGIEIAFSLRKRWPKRTIQLKVKSDKKLPKNIIKSLKIQNIQIIENDPSNYLPKLLCTGNKAYDWIRKSNLPLDNHGRIFTKKTLQILNHPELFAVGDCGVIQHNNRPASGVWAVRSSIPLAKNLEATRKSLIMNEWKPQKRAIQILDINSSKNDSRAFLSWGGLIIGPHKIFSKYKELIDKNFISRFDLANKLVPDMFPQNEMIKCRGCAAKLAYMPLNKALKQLNSSEYFSDDSIDIAQLISGKTLIQSVDGFPSLISDPWLNGRLLAFHSCSDIWACGGSVLSAQAVVKIPSLSNDLQQELLFQVLEGINSALNLQGAKLIGGHTLESIKTPEEPFSIEIESSLTVNGIVEDKKNFWSKGGMKKGDQILISRPLGTGVIFSAFMNGQVQPFVLDSVLKEMNKSQHEIVNYIIYLQNINPYSNIISACTDITGFGLLGHLAEMLKATNNNQIKMNLEPMKIILDLDKIPVFYGVKELLDKGFESTFSPSNKIFFKKIYSDKNLGIELRSKEFSSDSPLYNRMLKVLLDPQTCGPLVISCSSIYSEKLIKNGPWKKIGFIN